MPYIIWWDESNPAYDSATNRVAYPVLGKREVDRENVNQVAREVPDQTPFVFKDNGTILTEKEIMTWLKGRYGLWNETNGTWFFEFFVDVLPASAATRKEAVEMFRHMLLHPKGVKPDWKIKKF